MSPSSLPLPPVELAIRVGDVGAADPLEAYEAIGASLKLAIAGALPPGWQWTEKRALDFGAGAGRVLRHFAAEAANAEFWGCDIDRPSIDWLREHLSPPFHGFVVDERPALPQEDCYFDVAWAMSVFTHLTDHWAGWLLELHRVMKPGGYLIATFMGANMSRELLGEPWDDARVGMNVVGAGRPWNEGGPWVFHSEWWLRAHWGRAFEFVSLETNEAHPGTHGLVVLRKKPVNVAVGELERPEPGESREIAAVSHNIRQLHDEDRRVRARVTALEARIAGTWSARAWRRIRPTRLGRQIRAASLRLPFGSGGTRR